MLDLFVLLLSFLLVVALTFGLENYAQRFQLMDIPNDRSSHETPTPRGGGVSVVLVFLGFVSVLLIQDRLLPSYAFSMLLGGGVIAAVGFWDDHQHIPARYRVTLHLLAAGLALFLLPGLPGIPMVLGDMHLGLLGYPFFVVALVWFLNLFNFMDGVDGIASVEAISIAGGAGLILLAQSEFEWAFLCFGLVICVGGFLVWNWPPARIFMGDACSGFLGLIIGLLAIIVSIETDMSIWSWVILSGVFIVDATVTLVRRMLGGDVWYEAHRSHGYQILSRRWGEHKRVTLAVLLTNFVWLMPLAVAANNLPLFGALIALGSVCPLVMLACQMGAGANND